MSSYTRTSPRAGQLTSKAFFYARSPMLLVRADGVLVDMNAASRELFGLDIAGCKGEHYSFLLEQLATKIEGPFFPPSGVSTRSFARGQADMGGVLSHQLDTAELQTAVVECHYHSPQYGRTVLRVSETPCTDTPSGACCGSIISLDVVAIPTSAFHGALDQRLAHHVMWEVYAASYDRVLPELPFYQEVVNRHVARLGQPDIDLVLDVGAGTGSVTERLLQDGKRVTAIDVNRAMLQRLEDKIDSQWIARFEVIEDTAERLPHFADSSFDAVTVLLAFFDMENPLAALNEALRVLKPNGTIVITEPRGCFDVSRLMAAAERALREKGLMERLASDWNRIQTVAPLVREAVREKESRKQKAHTKQDWHAEAIFERLQRERFVGLSFELSHLDNCATIAGIKG
jgi:ubiquinone/menaquinone biosynthesis C-methylase UbiE